jgi:prolyl-tRNA editing enzyme YbaK/EbsC (Cys-tRNA(Pro) deacylase)
MGIREVRVEFELRGIELDIIELDSSSATVDMAAQALGVEPGRIAKTLAFSVQASPILILMKGDAKISNRKFKDRFKVKAKFLSPDEVLAATGHPVGGVCPFGLPSPLPVFLDTSLKSYDYVFPAAGSQNSAIRIGVEQLADITHAEWVDIAG